MADEELGEQAGEGISIILTFYIYIKHRSVQNILTSYQTELLALNY